MKFHRIHNSPSFLKTHFFYSLQKKITKTLPFSCQIKFLREKVSQRILNITSHQKTALSRDVFSKSPSPLPSTAAEPSGVLSVFSPQLPDSASHHSQFLILCLLSKQKNSTTSSTPPSPTRLQAYLCLSKNLEVLLKKNIVQYILNVILYRKLQNLVNTLYSFTQSRSNSQSSTRVNHQTMEKMKVKVSTPLVTLLRDQLDQS